MKQKDLLQATETVTPALASKDILPALTCLCFKTNTVTAFNGFTAVSCKLKTGFEGLISGHTFVKVLSSLKDEEISFDFDDEILNFKTGKKKKGKIRYQTTEDFPELGMWNKKLKFKKAPKEFLDAVHLVKFAAATKEVNPVLRGVQVKDEWVVGADNFRISRYKLPEKCKYQMILPRVSAEILSRSKDEELKGFTAHKDGVLFDFGNYRIFTQLIEGEPLVDKIEGHFDGYKGKVDLPEELMDALDRVKIITQKEIDRQVKISIGGGIISCSSESSYFGEIQEEYDVKMHKKLKPVSFTTDPIYFSEIVARAAKIGYKDPGDPVYFESENCQHLIQTIADE